MYLPCLYSANNCNTDAIAVAILTPYVIVVAMETMYINGNDTVTSIEIFQQTRDADPMLAHRLRRRQSIKPAPVQRLVFAGIDSAK